MKPIYKADKDMAQKICDKFNAEHEVGTAGMLKKDFENEPFETKTRSTAQVMCMEPVAWFENVSGSYLLDRFTPNKETTGA